MRDGDWWLLDRRPAGGDDGAWERVIAFAWQAEARRLLVAVNYGPTAARCRLPLPWPDLEGGVVLEELVGPSAREACDGATLAGPGLAVDLPAWGARVLAVTRAG